MGSLYVLFRPRDAMSREVTNLSASDSGTAVADPINAIRANLLAMRRLLLTPSPSTISHLVSLVEGIKAQVDGLAGEGTVKGTEWRQLQQELVAATNLLKGALRVQWAQMRTVIALTQYYMPSGRSEHWRPVKPQFDVKI